MSAVIVVVVVALGGGGVVRRGRVLLEEGRPNRAERRPGCCDNGERVTAKQREREEGVMATF